MCTIEVRRARGNRPRYARAPPDRYVHDEEGIFEIESYSRYCKSRGSQERMEGGVNRGSRRSAWAKLCHETREVIAKCAYLRPNLL